MNWINILVFGMATWRISALLTKETGPFHIFEKLRKHAGIVHDADGLVVMIPHKFFAELLSCVWCASIWVGSFWVIFWFVSPTISTLCALPFGISAIAIIVDHFF
jgi:hypothetical protein